MTVTLEIMKSEAEVVGPNVPSDAELIRRSVVDAREFGGVFDRHYDSIYRYLARRVGPDLAEEIASDTFLGALDSLGRYYPRSNSALPWLYGIASNLLGKHHRTESRRFRAMARAAVPDHGDGDLARATERMDAGRSGPRIAEALGRMNSGDRDALLLFTWEDLSYEEIARALDIPVGTVRSRINRARKGLRSTLADLDPTDWTQDIGDQE